MEQKKQNVLIDVFFRSFYMKWGGILLLYPAAVIMAWAIITSEAQNAVQAREMFMESFVLFSYYPLTWMLAVLLCAIPLFFGVRLCSGNRNSKIVGVLMALVAGAGLAFSVLRIWGQY